MSAYALRACALIRIQARAGEWVALDDLVQHLAQPVERVRNVCQQLVEASSVHFSVRDGREYYGIGVEGVAP